MATILRRFKRPNIKIPVNSTEIRLELLSLIGLFFVTWCAASLNPSARKFLPVTQNVLSLGSHSDAVIKIFYLTLGIYLFWTIVRLFFLHLVNYPPPITQENAERKYSIMRTWISTMKTELVWIFVIDIVVIGTGPIFLIVFFIMIALLLVTTGFFFYRLCQI